MIIYDVHGIILMSYMFANYATHSGRITMNESVTVRQTTDNRGGKICHTNRGNRGDGCSNRNTGIFTAGNKVILIPMRMLFQNWCVCCIELLYVSS